ncbi:MAG TPA: hypothetical protein VGP82_04655 [Ktedonobacterales bacterium]|nr:hypothetical protein [Ktedonobacterales bacterium]
MRAIVRVGLILGGIGFLALFALQFALGLAVAPLLVGVGLLTGICSAKWLDWAWYGHQFRAGTFAGFYACTLAGIGALVSLVSAGPHEVKALASASHLGSFSLAPVIERTAVFGWIGIEVLLLLLAGLFGVFVAGLSTQILAMSKNTRTVRVVTQARVAAEPLARRDTFMPTPSGARAGDSILPSPRSQPGVAASPSTPGAGWRTPVPVAPQQVWQSHAYASAAGAPPARQVATPTPPPQQAVQPPAEALPKDGRLSAVEREALETWARDNDNEPKPSRKRQPKASAYLNGPAPKRSRKKQDTRDWLC